MPPQRIWSPSVFDSYAHLQSFLQQSEAIGQVLSKKDKPYSNLQVPLNPHLACQWRVCQIATAPFRWTLAALARIIHAGTSLVGAKTLAKRAKICSRHLIAGFNVYSNESTKLFRIQNTYNAPNHAGKVVNKNPFIPEAQITDPKVKSKTFYSIDKGITFNHHQGICRGMSDWFVYLYLNTKDAFTDPRAHMKALGKQFSHGGGIDPTLLQSIRLNKGKLLGLKIGTQSLDSHSAFSIPTHLLKQSTAEWKSKTKQIIEQLQNIPQGASRIHIPRHAIAYVRINSEQAFYFDPNHGITEICGVEQAEKLYKLISKSLRDTGEFDNCPLFNEVTITPVTKR